MRIDFASPHLIDAILIGVGAEALLLYLLWPRLRAAADLWLTLASGAALMGALRIALADGPPSVIAGALSIALAAHLLYLRARIRR